MTRITKWAFGNKAAVIVSVVLVLLLGVVTYFTIPMEMMPAADQPEITISVMGQGLDANSMQENVTTPIEDAVSNVKGKQNIYTTTGDGFAQLNMSFDASTKMKDAKQQVQDALASITLPEGVSKPYVLQLDTSMIPVTELGITFKDGISSESIDTVQKEIVPMFEQVKGVGSVQVNGITQQQVLVHLDQEKLAKTHVPLQAVMGVLQGKNMAVAIGDQVLDGKDSNLKVIGKIDSIDVLKNITIAPNVHLQDVATVETQPNTQTVTHLNGKDCIDMVIMKDSSSNAVAVNKDVNKTIDTVNSQYSPGIQTSVLFSTADLVKSSVNGMTREVLMGALFATIIILLFLRSVRTTIITIVSIPLSLCLTLFLLSMSGITLNILTLGGVAVAVGRLVDDSIVVIENIYRRSQTEKLSRELVIDAVREVATAITASTLTTVAVFLPIGLIQGLQQIVLPFALTVTYSLLSSLLVALTVVPLMGSSLMKKSKFKEHKAPKRYIQLLTWCLNHKWVPVILAILMMVGSVGLYSSLPKGSSDQKDSSMVQVVLKYPAETKFDTVKENAIKLEKYMSDQPEPQNVILMLGNSEDAAKWGKVSAPTTATITAIMKSDVDATGFVQRIRNLKDQYNGAELTAETASFMGSNKTTVTVDVMGNTLADVQTGAKQVEDAIKGIDGVQKVETNQDDTKSVYEITVDPSVGNAQELSTQLRSLLNPTPIGNITLNGKNTMVLLDATQNPTTEQDLSNILVATKTGIVPLNKLAKIEKTQQPASLLGKDGHNYITVTAQCDPKKVVSIGTEAKTKVDALKLPKGVTTSYGGTAEQSSSQMTDMLKTMGIAIGIVYLIMVITFKELRAPLAILFSLPLASIGALLGLAITKTSIDPLSSIGFLMLIGIVVTNAIVLIDRVKHNEQHMTIREAILEAGSVRMRPILMTAIATVFAMLPLVFMKQEVGSIVGKGLAIIVIGGLILATLLTLVIIPVIYELFHFRKSKKQRVGKLSFSQKDQTVA